MGPLKRSARITPDKERVWNARKALQVGVGGHIVVAVEEVGAAVPIIASRARHDVDGAAGGDGRRDIEIHFGKLEFLHGLLREIHGGHPAADVDVVRDIAAVDGDGRTVAAAQNADLEQNIELRHCSRGNLDARFERAELQIAAAVQRQVLDGAARS